MTEKEQHGKTYQYLLDKYGPAVIYERVLYWTHTVDKVIVSLDLQDKAYLNKGLLYQVLIDYFSDIERLKAFHDIERVNIIKICAYSIFWFLRVSPVQLKCEIPSPQKMFINEKVAVLVLAGEFIPPACKPEIVNSYLDYLFYFFKYRLYTAQTIENHITSLLVGCGQDPFIRSSSNGSEKTKINLYEDSLK